MNNQRQSMRVERSRLVHGAVSSIALAFAVSACSVGPGTASQVLRSPLASPAAPAAAQPSAQAGDEVPIFYPADNMWAYLASMPGLQRRAETLDEAVSFADAVVVGRYVGVERGGQYGSDSTATALIALESVAKGSPVVGPDGLLRVEFVLVVGSSKYPEKEFADLERSIPKDPALLYLFSWESYFDLTKDKLAGWSERSDLAAVYKTIGGDGAMRIVNDRIEPPSYIDGWPTALHDKAVETALADVRAAAAKGNDP